MSRYFLDTSALVKLYVQEDGTEELLRLADLPDTMFTVLALTRVEIFSVLRRRLREKSLSAETLQAIACSIEEHWQTFFLVQPVTDAILGEAINLLQRHPLRAYDAVQLSASIATATILAGTPNVFVCSDPTLLAAARQEGLATLNPEQTVRRKRSG